MNRQQLEQYLGNPHVRKMLDVIASSEGVKHGYNTLFGNERFDDLVSHPNIRKQFKQTDGKVNYTTAAGRYQFLNSTWNDVARQYGLKSFSPINQDLAAIALIARRGALNDVVKGNYQSAIHKLGEEWASLPTSRYAQGKRSWGDINKMLGGSGTSGPNYLANDQVAKLFPQRPKQSNLQPNYLSDQQAAALFQPQKANSSQPNYLSDEQAAQLFSRG
ncbi:glycoside hydrolase family 24 protein [Acinetobacter radioresistens]|uniref:glycoside hydrolase family 24 protein n=1 Tax=Acinetobacter radioresistens TaxID=40216 RepID=UPI003263510E